MGDVDCLHSGEITPAKAEQNMVVDGSESGSRKIRLDTQRKEMYERVRIPDTWGKERFLNEWKDNSVIDQSLSPAGITSARKALVEECRRARASQL